MLSAIPPVNDPSFFCLRLEHVACGHADHVPVPVCSLARLPSRLCHCHFTGVEPRVSQPECHNRSGTRSFGVIDFPGEGKCRICIVEKVLPSVSLLGS